MPSYNRKNAFYYAKQWAYKRNPQYYNYDKLGGDCTNFVSQCIHAGCYRMNYEKYGWYYNNANDKSPSWTGVEYLYNFLIDNTGIGPYAIETDSISKLEIGDIIQLSFTGSIFAHALLVVKKGTSTSDTLIACHTIDSFMRSVSSYSYKKIRFLHIEGIR